MATTSAALADIKSRLTGGGSGISITLYFRGDTIPPLPDTPTAFAYIFLENEGSGRGPVAFGGGVGGNLYRNEGTLNAYVFSPRNAGEGVVLDYAETIAARLRSYRSSVVSCYSADVIPLGAGSNIAPPGLNQPVNNYQCALAEISLHFDQIG